MASPSSHPPLPDHLDSISRLASRFVTHLFACPESPPKPAPSSNDAKEPSLSSFIAYALYRTRLHHSVTFAALALLQRLKLRFPTAKGSSGHRLFISAFMISSKVCCDDTYSNKSWSIVSRGMFSLREINQMEREMCNYLDWELTFEPEYLSRFASALERDFGESADSPTSAFGRRTAKPAAKSGRSHACGCGHPDPRGQPQSKRAGYTSGFPKRWCPYCDQPDMDDGAPDGGLVGNLFARFASRADRKFCHRQALHPLPIRHATEKAIYNPLEPSKVVWHDKPLSFYSRPNDPSRKPVPDSRVEPTADTSLFGAQQQCAPPGADSSSLSDTDTIHVPDLVAPAPNPPPPPPPLLPSSPASGFYHGFVANSSLQASCTLLWKVVAAIPLFLYHTLLLHLPAVFYHRVLHTSSQWVDIESPLPECHSRAMRCSDMLQKEWKYQTLVDITMIPAILTMFQVPFIVNDVITYHLALTCLSFAFMSLLFNTIFQFHSDHCQYLVYSILSGQDIERPFKRALWDHYVLLSIPTVWFAWTIMFALASVVSIIWHPLDSAGSKIVNRAIATISKVPFFGLRLSVTFVLIAGLICLVLAVKTLRAVSQLSNPVLMNHLSSGERSAQADQ